MRYIRLYIAYAKSSLMGKLTYKANVFVGLISFLFSQITSILTVYFLVRVVPSIDGYTMYDIGFLFGITNMAMGLDHLVSDRLWLVAYHEVKNGKLDQLFLRPVPVLFQVFASEIQLEAFGEILTAIFLLVFCGMNVTFVFTAGGVVLLVLGVLCASIVITSFKVIIAALAFILKRSGPLLQIVYNFCNYAKYPLKIYPSVIKFILSFIIPLGLCIFFPFENLFNPKYNPYLLGFFIVFVTIVFSCVAGIIWSYCAKRYESTGS